MKNEIYIWCCDISLSSGEGILANKFLSKLKKNNRKLKIRTYCPNIKIKEKTFKDVIDRFFIPILGVIFLWLIFIFKRNKKLCYVNYLPLWNFILFVLLPPNTLLGPITGGSNYLKKPFFNYFLRKFIIKFLSRIGSLILKLRKNHILFSTDLLREYFPLNKNYYFNFVLEDLKLGNSNNKKKFDIVFYLRSHRNKNKLMQIKLIKELSKNYKILTVGDLSNITNVKDLGKIDRKKLLNYLKITKYAFISAENLYSFFCIDCLKSGTYIFHNNFKIYNPNIKKRSIKADYNNFDKLLKIINRQLKKKYIATKDKKIVNFRSFDYYFRI